MKNLFKDILSIEDVQGVLFFSIDGTLLYKNFTDLELEEKDWSSAFRNSPDWPSLARVFDECFDSELVFKKKRIYIKKIDSGYIIILMGFRIPFSLIRLNCEMIIPELNQIKKSKGLGRFFKRK
jgi:hypothetical protein